MTLPHILALTCVLLIAWFAFEVWRAPMAPDEDFVGDWPHVPGEFYSVHSGSITRARAPEPCGKMVSAPLTETLVVNGDG